MKNSLTYNDIKVLCNDYRLPVIGNRLDAVFKNSWEEEVDSFLEVLKRYFDISTRKEWTQVERDFCNEIISIMDCTNTWELDSISNMVQISKQKLDNLLEWAK